MHGSPDPSRRARRPVPRPPRGGRVSAPRARRCCWSRGRTPPSTSRASSPTTSRRSARARAATRRCSTARATSRPTCGYCRLGRPPREIGDRTSSLARPGPAVLKHLTTVQHRARRRGRGRHRALGDHLADRPPCPGAGGLRGTGARACPATSATGTASRSSAVATDLGLDLITRAEPGMRRCAGCSPPPEPSR